MKNLKIAILCTIIILLSVSIAGATTYTLSPLPNDLGDLDHSWAYKWGVDWSLPSGETIVGASLFFDEFQNWKSEPNDLFVTLLDSAETGVKMYRDNQAAGDYFTGTGLLLNQFHDVSNVASDTTYDFSNDELTVLKVFLADGNIGLGFDPDCHFWNNGIYLSIETAATPIPAPILLLGTGLIGMAGFRSRHGRNRL
jgi:hypothetical protein